MSTHPPPVRDQKRLNSLKAIGQDALKYAIALKTHEESQTKIQKRIKLANYAVAALVMLFGFLSFIPVAKQQLGDSLSIAITLLGACFLLLDAYSPHLLDDPNPERFRDYAFYIRKYARDIETHCADTDMPDAHWIATADLLSDWARTNLDDVALKFGKVMKKIQQ
jgi:hypothetical protein